MHAAAPDEQPWIPSRVDWQSVFLPQAASCFAQVLSMHLPQSVLSSVGGGGVLAAVLSELGVEVSAAGAADADSAGAAESEAAGASELEDAELSPAGLSGGLDSPPPHAKASGTEAMRTRVATE
jgi:hypothetical protein